MKRCRFAQLLWSILLISLSSSLCFSQNFTNGFNFYLPPRDTGSTRFIPQFPRTPLTDQDFVSIDGDGHFSVRGKPIRFFGTNVLPYAAFPVKSEAWFIAGRLRKMGFNLVRLHSMDNPWGTPLGTSLFFPPPASTRELNPTTLDRLDNLLAELKSNGIYSDINLHVSRRFTSLDGLPDTDSLQDYGKAINYFDPAVLALHKEYAKQLLTHVSPYTGKSLVNDPVMAMVEITNENCLYHYWKNGKLKLLAEGGILTARHNKMLDTLWLSYLRSRYATTSALSSAWNAGSYYLLAGNQVLNGTFENSPSLIPWIMEIHFPADAYMVRDSTTHYSGKYSAKVVVTNTTETDWYLQWKQIGLKMIKDTVYLVSFAARSDSARSIRAFISDEIPPWTIYENLTIQLQPQWTTYSFYLRAPVTSDTLRLSFAVGGQVGTYWFDDISMIPVRSGLLPDESLATSFVRRIDYDDCHQFSDQRIRDISSFYIKLEDDYFVQMHSYLKDTLNVRVPIVGTNWLIGPADMAVQSKLDFIDNHGYWDIPNSGTGRSTDPGWTISNTAMVNSKDGGSISQMVAAVPASRKPFTVSEYNHAFPNRYQSELMLFTTSYGSFHSVDAFMYFNYSGEPIDDWDTDWVEDFYEFHRNSAMMALVPSCALAYRSGMISHARQTLIINYAPDDYLLLPRQYNPMIPWADPPSQFDPILGLKYGVRTGSFSSTTPLNPLSLPSVPTNPYVTDTKEITWNTDGLLTVASGRFAGATGFLNSFINQSAGPLTIKAASGFGTFTWVSLTNDSLQMAPLSLLTISTRVQNTGMVWDGTSSINDHWGTSPTQVEPLNLSLQLTMQADSIRVYPLDTYGRETKGLSTYLPTSANTFAITIDQNRLQSMWFGIQAFKGSLKPSFVARLSDTTIAQNQTLSFTYTATDLYRDSLKFMLVNPPPGASLTPAGVFRWTPSYTQQGIFSIVAVVSKTFGSFSDTARATVTVMRVSAKPSFLAKLRDTTIAQNTTLTFTYLATDPNGDSLKYTAVTLPPGATFTGTLFSWKPAYSQAGAFPVMVVVSKKSLAAYADTARATVTVTKVNQKPVLNSQSPAAGSLIAVSRNKPQTFAVSVTDPNGDPLTYTWKVNGGMVKTGSDSSYTQSFADPHNTPEWVRVIWSKPNGVMPDSVTWNFVITLISMDQNVIPTEFALAQNYPNPFNPSTNIQFDLPKSVPVTLEIYNILGVRIRALVRGEVMNAGRYTAVWEGRDEAGISVASGVYVYRISAGDFHASKKLALVR